VAGGREATMLVLCLSFLITLADQLTKLWVRLGLRLGDSISLIPGFFSLSHVQNTGAAWGLFAGLNGWLVVISILILCAMILFRKHFAIDTRLRRVALGLMIGGILGNLLDRLRLGYVVDFLDVFWGPHHFPAFNLADSAICVGVGLYVLTQMRAGGGKPAVESGQA
jgi:signal peptidase II